MFRNRRNHLKTAIEKMQLDIALIDSPSNLYYYTGFTGGEAMLVIPASKEESACYLITDSRYYEQVEKECPEITLIKLDKREYVGTIKELLERFAKSDNCLSDVAKSRKKSIKETGIANEVSVGVEESMNLARYLKLCETCKGVSFQVAGECIHESRVVKDEEELKKIAKAEAIGDEAFTYILDIIKPGVTEAEIALELEFFMKRQGASKLSFDTIVASGPNASMPHAQVSNRKIEPGDFVTMDFGCVYQGYCSDMTRTVAVGNPTEEMKQVYQIVLDANRLAMEGIMAGRRCNDIDALARNYIKKQGYGKYFGHGLGHGVGLDIHEEPRFSPNCSIVIKENMVITNEPGIYLPGRFGVRIEDLTVVKKNGSECLSHSNRKMIIL